jgi:hypothetical protein
VRDLGAILGKKMEFADSRKQVGLQIADALTTCVRRALILKTVADQRFGMCFSSMSCPCRFTKALALCWLSALGQKPTLARRAGDVG